ncbi:hypothetical protein ACIBCM_14040 [Streptomyces sp. NPDC051018]|uniref:hypothetical protein n=1 Tax=Streptomyces sp. NPDC051018 TaxID=3365639 RepID=UPI0037A093A2
MAVRAAERLRAVEEVVEQLRTELGEMGVKLPSLNVDPVSLARDDPHPLIDLGRCNLDTALRLAAALHKARG